MKEVVYIQLLNEGSVAYRSVSAYSIRFAEHANLGTARATLRYFEAQEAANQLLLAI